MGNLLLFEQFLKKRISSAYRSSNYYWKKKLDVLSHKINLLIEENESLKSKISVLNSIAIPQVPLESPQETATENPELLPQKPILVLSPECPKEKSPKKSRKKSQEPCLVPQSQVYLDPSPDRSLDPYPDQSPETSPKHPLEPLEVISSTEEYETDSIPNIILERKDLTYADICKRIPESLFKMKELNRQIQWIKMNVPNLTGLYIPEYTIQAISWKLWNQLRSDRDWIMEDFMNFQNMMIERYDFLRRKELENDPYFKAHPTQKKRKKTNKHKNYKKEKKY